MQENNRDFSIIKERIMKFLEYKGVSKYEFYQKTGISNGILSQKNGLSEENLLRFLNYFGEISPEWLLLGKGEMLRNTTTANNQDNDDKVSRLITILQDTLAEKDKQIDQLLKIINRISSNTNNKQI